MTGAIWLLAAVVATAVIAWALSKKNGSFSHREDAEMLTVEQIGTTLGERATLVQFSSSFCSPCRATRVLLNDLITKVDGVAYVDIDAEAHLALVRELHIMRTPTVLVLDKNGVIVERASGLPRRVDVIAELGRAIPE